MLVDLRPKEINGKQLRKFSIGRDHSEQERHSFDTYPIFNRAESALAHGMLRRVG